MANVNLKVLVPAKIVENTQTTQYTSTNATTEIGAIEVTNYSGTAATISINLVTSGDTPGNQNLVIKTKSIAAGATYTFPELWCQYLAPGDYISTIASAATSLNIRISGREFT
jgi:hypothetical protein